MFFFVLFFGEDFVTIFQITILTAIRSCTEIRFMFVKSFMGEY